MDIDSLPLGVDFVDQLERSLHQTDVALVLIGPQWLAATDESGARRLDDPDDFVRLEVAAALRSDARVIPVLVDGAPMPRSDELPEELRFLARRQGLVFNRAGGSAIRDLMNAIRQAGEGAGATAPVAAGATARAGESATARAGESDTARAGESDSARTGQPEAPRRSRRRAVALAAGAVVVAAIAAIVIVVAGGSTSHAPARGSGSHAHLSGKSPVSEGIPVGNSPDGITIGNNYVWVANAGDGTVTQITETSPRVVHTIPYASNEEPAAPIAIWDNAVWVGDSRAGKLDEIDLTTGKLTGTSISVGGDPSAITVANGDLWVANTNGTVAQVVVPSAGTGSTTPVVNDHISVTPGPQRLAKLNDSLWVANLLTSTLTPISLTTLTASNSIHVGGQLGAMTSIDGRLWLADRQQDTVTPFNVVTGRTAGPGIQVGRYPKRMAAGDGSIWVSDHGDGTVTHIDASAQSVVKTITVGGYPDSITGSNNVLWVAVWKRPTSRYHGPRGVVVRIDETNNTVVGG
jgi:YVTN family beta-propeller protein